jgi:hypothetical protein
MLYTYSIAGSFPNKTVCPDVLQQQIKANIQSIDHIDTCGDDCNIYFLITLSQYDKMLLDQIVAAHQGVETITYCPTCGRPM